LMDRLGSRGSLADHGVAGVFKKSPRKHAESRVVVNYEHSFRHAGIIASEFAIRVEG
jgi:hypothetical protein